jgi:hypothetical protein
VYGGVINGSQAILQNPSKSCASRSEGLRIFREGPID